jgi:hypothetical protein
LEEKVELVLQQCSMNKSHLIHVPVYMQQFHGGGVGADLVELAVLVGLEQTRRLAPDGLVVYVVDAGTAVAVVGCDGLEGAEEDE